MSDCEELKEERRAHMLDMQKEIQAMKGEIKSMNNDMIQNNFDLTSNITTISINLDNLSGDVKDLIEVINPFNGEGGLVNRITKLESNNEVIKVKQKICPLVIRLIAIILGILVTLGTIWRLII